MVSHNFVGSHLRNSGEIIEWLRTLRREDGGPKYNVTVFSWLDNTDFSEDENLHIIRYPFNQPKNTNDLKKETNIMLQAKLLA